MLTLLARIDDKQEADDNDGVAIMVVVALMNHDEHADSDTDTFLMIFFKLRYMHSRCVEVR